MSFKVGDKVNVRLSPLVGIVRTIDPNGSITVDFPADLPTHYSEYESKDLDLVESKPVLGAMSGTARRVKPSCTPLTDASLEHARANGIPIVHISVPAQDLLTVAERKAMEYVRYLNIDSHWHTLFGALDRLAPKPIVEPVMVSGWEACEDMRKRPDARYRREDSDWTYRYEEYLRCWKPGSGGYLGANLLVDSLDIVDWVKLA